MSIFRFEQYSFTKKKLPQTTSTYFHIPSTTIIGRTISTITPIFIPFHKTTSRVEQQRSSCEGMTHVHHSCTVSFYPWSPQRAVWLFRWNFSSNPSPSPPSHHQLFVSLRYRKLCVWVLHCDAIFFLFHTSKPLTFVQMTKNINLFKECLIPLNKK